MAEKADAIVRPIREGPITDLQYLLRRIRRLEAHGLGLTVYPDAEEYIQTRLTQQRIAATVADIRGDPKAHPPRSSLWSNQTSTSARRSASQMRRAASASCEA